MSIIEDLRNLEKIVIRNYNKIAPFFEGNPFFKIFDDFNFELKKSFFGRGKVNTFFRVNILPVLKDEEFVSREDCGVWFTALLNYFHEKHGLSRVVILDADQKFFESEYLFAYLNAKNLKIEIKQKVKKIGYACTSYMSGGSVVFGDVGSVGDSCADVMSGGSVRFGNVGDSCADVMSGGSLVFNGDVKSVGYGCAFSMSGGSVVFGSVGSVDGSCARNMTGGSLVFNGDVFLEHRRVTIFKQDILATSETFVRGKSGVFFSKKIANKIADWFEKENTQGIIRKLDLLELKKLFNRKNKDDFFTYFLTRFLGIVYNSLEKEDAEKFLINIREKLESEEAKLMMNTLNIKHKPIATEIQKKYK